MNKRLKKLRCAQDTVQQFKMFKMFKIFKMFKMLKMLKMFKMFKQCSPKEISYQFDIADLDILFDETIFDDIDTIFSKGELIISI